jgi:hypothetical protein
MPSRACEGDPQNRPGCEERGIRQATVDAVKAGAVDLFS